ALATLCAALASTASAQEQSPCQRAAAGPDTPVRQTIGPYTVYAYYDHRKAVVGEDLTLNICIETVAPPNLLPVGCDECRPDSALFDSYSSEAVHDGDIPPDEKDVRRVSKYHYDVRLKPEIAQRRYVVSLYFQPPALGSASPANVPMP